MANKRFAASTAVLSSLGIVLFLASGSIALGQQPRLPSGSGSGTGTGMESGSGVGTTGTGVESGTGLGSTGTGLESGGLIRRGTGGSLGPIGPGARQRRMPGMPNRSRSGVSTGGVGGDRSPSDPSLIDALGSQELGSLSSGKSLTPAELKRLHELVLERVRGLTNPAERALAMVRIARSQIFANDFTEARKTLLEASKTALSVPDASTRDLRIVAAVTTFVNLAESEARESKLIGEPTTYESLSNRPPPAPEPGNDRRPSEPLTDLTYPKFDRVAMSKDALFNWSYAAWLATKLDNPDYRSDTLFQVVDSESRGSEQSVLDIELLEAKWAAAKSEFERMPDMQPPPKDEGNEAAKDEAEAPGEPTPSTRRPVRDTRPSKPRWPKSRKANTRNETPRSSQKSTTSSKPPSAA